jgi:hypothetical protein
LWRLFGYEPPQLFEANWSHPDGGYFVDNPAFGFDLNNDEWWGSYDSLIFSFEDQMEMEEQAYLDRWTPILKYGLVKEYWDPEHPREVYDFCARRSHPHTNESCVGLRFFQYHLKMTLQSVRTLAYLNIDAIPYDFITMS